MMTETPGDPQIGPTAADPHATPPTTRTDKGAMLARVRTLKKQITGATILGFGLFIGLVAAHTVGSANAATTGTTGSTSTSTGGGATQVAPSVPQPQDDQSQGGFFNQGGGGYGFGSAQSGPVAGSGAS